jgi:hypothetical protein
MTNKNPEQQAQEYAPNDKLREYLAITTPEDKAAEWVSRRVEFSGEDESPNISHLIDKELKIAYLAGHAAGKQDERERIANALPNADHFLIDGAGNSFINLNSVMAIIKGAEKP